MLLKISHLLASKKRLHQKGKTLQTIEKPPNRANATYLFGSAGRGKKGKKKESLIHEAGGLIKKG